MSQLNGNLYGFLAAPKDQINLDQLRYTYGNVSYKQFAETYGKDEVKGSLSRKLNALPAAAGHLMQIVYRVATVAFNAIACVFSRNSTALKVSIFSLGQDVKGLTGRVLSLFSDKLGLYLIDGAAFQKKCYSIVQANEVHLKKAQSLISDGKFTDAANHVRQILFNTPSRRAIAVQLIDACLVKDQVSEAIEVIKENDLPDYRELYRDKLVARVDQIVSDVNCDSAAHQNTCLQIAELFFSTGDVTKSFEVVLKIQPKWQHVFDDLREKMIDRFIKNEEFTKVIQIANTYQNNLKKEQGIIKLCNHHIDQNYLEAAQLVLLGLPNFLSSWSGTVSMRLLKCFLDKKQEAKALELIKEIGKKVAKPEMLSELSYFLAIHHCAAGDVAKGVQIIIDMKGTETFVAKFLDKTLDILIPQGSVSLNLDSIMSGLSLCSLGKRQDVIDRLALHLLGQNMDSCLKLLKNKKIAGYTWKMDQHVSALVKKYIDLGYYALAQKAADCFVDPFYKENAQKTIDKELAKLCYDQVDFYIKEGSVYANLPKILSGLSHCVSVEKSDIAHKVATFFINQKKYDYCLEFLQKLKNSSTDSMLLGTIDQYASELTLLYLSKNLFDQAEVAAECHSNVKEITINKILIKQARFDAYVDSCIQQKSVQVNLVNILNSFDKCSEKKKIELLSKIANYFIGQNELEKCLQFFAQVKVSLTEYQLRVAIDNHVEKVLNKYMEQGLYDEAFKAINFHRDQGVREKAKETVKTKKTYAILAFHINQKSVHANLDIILAEIGYCPTDDKLSVIESISNYYIQQHEYDNGIHFVNLLQQLYVDNKLGGINYTILVDGLIVMVVNECLKQKLYDQALKAAESHYSSGAKEYHIKRINEEKANAAAVPLNA